ncbi:hypothetical protein [Fibrobacter sp. UWB11]|uniref:hypothetical protein n=1 Tax=Fibrobacter sp. UWB11 TaxID=1896202 RepID=UPI0009268391|nr:hypothetical protein [Fibrobacter sp. UWB11]SIO43593.1 hypothetical protein SAMN05720758_2906 [Fibrobacter sp. UWB11]
MNIKKIIPLSFAALSVAGALSACSDSAVVGADEQANTMAENLLVEQYDKILANLKQISKPNVATAVILSYDNVINVDSVNAHETYNNAIRAMIDNDSVATSFENEEEWRHSSDNHFSSKMSHYYSMFDENGVMYGKIMVSEGITQPGIFTKGFYCFNESKWYMLNNDVYEIDEHYNFGVTSKSVHMEIRSKDSVMLAQFTEDCALENGQLESTGNPFVIDKGTANEHIELYPAYSCDIPLEQRAGTLYKDPLWKKYATYVADNCRSDYEGVEKFIVMPCPDDGCPNFQ